MNDQNRPPSPPPTNPKPTEPPHSAAAPAVQGSGLDQRVKYALVGVGAVVTLGLVFYAGMEYQSHRIASAFEDAFSDTADDSADFFDDNALSSDEDSDFGGSEEDTESSYGAPVPVGTAVTWTPTAGEEWSVRVTAIECGVESIPNIVENYDWDYETPEDEFLDATPAGSDKFCIVTSSWENTGKSEASLESYTTMSELVTEDGTEFTATEDDSTYTDGLSDTPISLNPGKSAEVKNVYTIDPAHDITAISLKPYEMMSEVQPLLFEAP